MQSRIDRKKEVIIIFTSIGGVLLLLFLKIPLEHLLSKINANELYADMIAGSLSRSLAILFLLILIARSKLKEVNGLSGAFRISNFQALFIPIGLIGLGIFAKADVYENAGFVLVSVFLILTLIIGFTEELLFRGVIFPLVTRVLGGKKYVVLVAAVFSSILFGLIHYINLFTEPGRFDLITSRVIFAFCIGMAFTGLFLRVKNIVPIAIFHGLFNFAFGTNKIQEATSPAPSGTVVDWPSLIFTLSVWFLIALSGVILISLSDKEEFIAKATRGKIKVTVHKLL